MASIDQLLAIPPGDFLVGAEATPYTLSYAFWVGQTPVTRQQYLRFIVDGGYAESRWWDPQGWALCVDKGWQAPYGWDDADTPDEPLLPVVGVSWYEARAYCRWLQTRLQEAHWPGLSEVPDDYQLRLPTTVEWERAARGTDGRRYPWGDTLFAGCANMGAHGSGRITQVRAHSDGISPTGALDMVGNVWEWTLNSDDDKTRITRGGSWFDLPEAANCWAQGQLNPTARNFPMWGLRVFLGPAQPDD